VENQSAREVQANVKAWNNHGEQATADESTEEEVDSGDNNMGDSAEDKVVDSETDSLRIEDEEQIAVPAMSSTVTDEDGLKNTAAVDLSAQSTENATRTISDDDFLKRPFNLDDYSRRMKK